MTAVSNDRVGRLRPSSPAWTVALAAVLTGLAWPIANGVAKASLDESWQIALHLAASRGLRHGVEIVFTYGPLGFLGFPHPYVDATSALALIAAIVIYLTLIGTMLVQARRILPLWASLLVTLLVARIFVLLPPFEALQALFALGCVEALAGRIRWPVPALSVLGGILAGAALLGKANIGIVVVLLGALTAVSISRPARRGLTIFIGATAASTLVLLLSVGQNLTDLPAFASGVYQIIAGYNEAMGADPQPTRTWIYLALAGSAAILVWCAWQSSHPWPRHRRIGLLALGLVFGFALWKTAIVREHATFVLATIMVLLFSFAPNIERRTWLIALIGVGIAFAGSSALQPRLYVDIVGSVRSFVGETADAFLPGRVDKAAERTRQQLRSKYQVEPSTLTAIGDHTVHVDPYFAAVVYAYPQLRWLPEPMFQSYSAYTQALDRLNADLLRSEAAPERILRSFRQAQPSDRLRYWMGRDLHEGEAFQAAVDGRFSWFESPEATLETFCHYQQTTATERWQVLARIGRSCGTPESLGTVTARRGETITIPVETRPDRFVIVRVHGLEPSLAGRVRSALTKAPDWYVRLDDTRYRLIPATAPDGLLLAVPPSADGTGPFAFGDPIRTIAAKQGLGNGISNGNVTYEFLSVPLIQR